MTGLRKERASFDRPRALAHQWFGVLGGAFAWMIALGAQYGLVEVACGTGSVLPLHLVAAATLLLALASLAVARQVWQRTRRARPDEEAGPVARSSFMATVGLMMSALFALLILAQWLGNVFLHPCMAI